MAEGQGGEEAVDAGRLLGVLVVQVLHHGLVVERRDDLLARLVLDVAVALDLGVV